MTVGYRSGISLPVGIPPGGNTDDELVKLSNDDYDADWVPESGGSGPGTGDVTQSQLMAAAGVAFALIEDADDPSPIIPGERGAQGAAGTTGAQGALGPAVLMSLDDLDVESPPVIPGARGADGAAGSTGQQGTQGLQIFMQAEDLDTEPAPIVPGNTGATGANGSSGAAGAAGLSILQSLDDVDVEPSPVIPGVAGAAGSTGANGSPGLSIVIQPEEYEQPPVIPGPQGATGASGGGGGSATEIEVDFGSTPVFDALFSVVDAGVSATSKVSIQESGKPATGRAAGDAQWDSISAAANPAAGSFALYCRAQPGPVVGKRKLHYSIAA